MMNTDKHTPPRRRLRQTALGLLMIASSAWAQPGSGSLTLNFVNAELEGVVKTVADAVGKTILVDPRVKGTLTLTSDHPVSPDEALSTLATTLRLQGFALVEANGLYRVVPEADAKLQAETVTTGGKSGLSGDQLATRVFQLHYESATNLVPVLRPLIAPNNTITAYPGNNTLVVTDYANNLERIARIVASIDAPLIGNAEVIPLHHALAVDLAPLINHITEPVGSSPDPALKTMALAEPRSNSLILRAATPARGADIRALIDKLDVPTAQPGNIWVVPLRNAEAVKLAKTLRGIVTGDNSALSSGTDASFGGSSPFAGGANGASSSPGGNSPTSTPTSSSFPTAGASTPGAGSSTGGGGYGGSGSSGSTGSNSAGSAGGSLPAGMIQADAATNSIIITANERVYRNLRNVIDRLDARRPQIYIESMIIEVSSNKAEELGVQLQGLLGSGSTQAYLGTNFNAANPGGNIVALGTQTNSLLNLGAGTTVPTVTPAAGTNLGILHTFNGVMGLAGLARAVSTIAGVNVLSTPNLLTLDNEEAKIVIATNIPMVSGQYAQTGFTGTVNPFTTVDRMDVGLTLRIRPQISEGGLVRMQLYEESSTIDNTTLNNVYGPNYNKRSLQSNVLVEDGQIIALGGLLADSYSDSMEKTPFLGDVPYLGALFRYETKTRVKTNLMIFLRPYVIRTTEQSDALTNDRYDWMRTTHDQAPSNLRSLEPEVMTPLPDVRNGGAPFVTPSSTVTTPTASPLPGAPSLPPPIPLPR